LYGNWSRLHPHLKAITMKMDAKLGLAQNRKNHAEEIIEKGLEWSIKNQFHHQSYHFSRLRWNIKRDFCDNRQKIIT
jgi:hypothetical protein